MIVKSLVEAVFVMDADKNLISQVLPYIDAIIFDEPSLIQTLVELSEKKERNFIKKLQVILIS